jgi:hypothetical protein
MSKQIMRDEKMFDALYIYNTHADELPNEVLLEMYNDYNLGVTLKKLKFLITMIIHPNLL